METNLITAGLNGKVVLLSLAVCLSGAIFLFWDTKMVTSVNRDCYAVDVIVIHCWLKVSVKVLNSRSNTSSLVTRVIFIEPSAEEGNIN